MNEDYDVLSQHDWESHPWLGQLKCASDLDGDAAFFITDSTPEVITALQDIQLQYSYDGESWEFAVGSDRAVFPSHGWAQADLAWYWPFFDHPLFALVPSVDISIRWRALVPRT